MPFWKVKVEKLNKRSSPIADLNNKSNIVNVVRKGYVFESKGEIVNNTGKWYTDKEGFYYWEKGLVAVAAPEVSSPSSVTPARDWWFSDYKVEQLWKHSKGENTTVAILDSGLNSSLSDFEGKSIRYYNALTQSTDEASCSDSNVEGHGTDGAAILCGAGKQIAGIAPGVTLAVIKITNQEGGFASSAILEGLKKAIDLKAEVISMSFSISENDPNLPLIHEQIQTAYQQNICVVAAAGNNGDRPKIRDDYPARWPECLSIGGLTRNKTRSTFSQLSNFLDLMGPGEDLASAARPQIRINGTSFAAPFVAGYIAIIKSVAKKSRIPLNNITLFDLLKRSADSQFTGYNMIEYGWGIVDPTKTIELLSHLKPIQ